MKIWFDKKNPAPKGYLWARDTDEVIKFITDEEEQRRAANQSVDDAIKSISIVQCDGFGMELLAWLKETGRNYVIEEHANESAVERYKRHKAAKNGESVLQEVYRLQGTDWVLVIRK